MKVRVIYEYGEPVEFECEDVHWREERDGTIVFEKIDYLPNTPTPVYLSGRDIRAIFRLDSA